MIKDPFFTEETPYDILGIDGNASRKEVKHAYLNFVRKNRGKVQKAQTAQKKINSASQRLGIDIMYYSMGVFEENVRVHNPEKIISQLGQPPVADRKEYLSGLFADDFSPEFSEISERKIVLADIKRMDNFSSRKPDISLLELDD